jgi:NADH-quinone oxidoreductase subunit N
MPTEGREFLFGNMLVQDWLGYSFTLLVVFGMGISALFAMDYDRVKDRGEFYLLLIISALGMSLMVYSADIVMLYLSIETTSIPLYILAGFMVNDPRSTESGFKYLLFGAMTSAVMLYGFSLLFGFSGTTNIYLIADGISGGELAVASVIGSLLLVLVGFGFKISVVPLHFWAPDVYEGAPTPVAGFLSTASKAVGFAVLARFLSVVFPEINSQWSAFLAVIAVATMTLGNLLAMVQKNIKRLLAYSSIAHAGYALIGVVAISEMGITSMVFYLIAYLVTNLAAFGTVSYVRKFTGSDDLSSYYGLSRRSPWAAMALLISFLSLAGMPPFGGFVAKVFVYAAAVKADLIWLAVIGVLNSIIGLYYYLTVLKYVYLYRSDKDDQAIELSRPFQISIVMLSVAIILIGAVFGPWMAWASRAAESIF